MWRRGVAALVFSFAIVSAGEPGGGIWDFLPEVVATVDGKPIRRSELSVQLPPGAVPDRAALIPLMRRAIEAKICFALIDELLRSAGIVPSRELALEYLKQLNSLLPRGIPGTPPERFPQLASQPQFQLNAALHRCFARMAPDQIKVTDQEIETFYRLNQTQFLLPEQFDLGIIQFPVNLPAGREEAETVRSRLLQGEAFDRVAREVNPQGVTLDALRVAASLRKEEPELKVGGISRPFRVDDFWVIVKRQVGANEVHAAFDQAGDALIPNSSDPRFFALPEPAMVHKNGVGALSGGRFDEIKRGGDAGHQTAEGIVFGLGRHIQGSMGE